MYEYLFGLFRRASELESRADEEWAERSLLERQGVAVSVYQTFWPAVSGATQYGLYAKGYQDPAYNYTGVATAPTSYIFTNIPGDGRVNACNANGCSGLSADAVAVTHQPQCGG